MDPGVVIVIPAATLDDPYANLWDYCRPQLAAAIAAALDDGEPGTGRQRRP